jgi:hypothetical protein
MTKVRYTVTSIVTKDCWTLTCSASLSLKRGQRGKPEEASRPPEVARRLTAPGRGQAMRSMASLRIKRIWFSI